jgi:hypothetical protein
MGLPRVTTPDDAVVIDVAEIVANRPAYRALGRVLLSYALSERRSRCASISARPPRPRSGRSS